MRGGGGGRCLDTGGSRDVNDGGKGCGEEEEAGTRKHGGPWMLGMQRRRRQVSLDERDGGVGLR